MACAMKCKSGIAFWAVLCIANTSLGACSKRSRSSASPATSLHSPLADAKHALSEEAVTVPRDMVAVPGATFFKGIDAPDSGLEQGEMASVNAFTIDRLEVTVAQYLECQREKKCDAALHDGAGCNATSKPPALNHPMNCITWREANEFCRAREKRLPTASEWELAARGTDRRPYPWGSALPSEQVCWQGRHRKQRTATCAVGSFDEGASPYGLLDMAGNVAEWTSSVRSGSYPPPIYEVRGGSYARDPMEDPSWTFLRVDFSAPGNPNTASPEIGFRCAKDLPQAP